MKFAKLPEWVRWAIAIVIMHVVVAMLTGCAGTEVVQKSFAWAVTEDGKIYKSRHEVTRGRAGALAARLDTGALTTYVEVDEDGSYVIDMSGETAGADAVAAAEVFADIANTFSEMLPAGQLVQFVAVLKSGASAEAIGAALTDALNSEE